MKANSIIQYVTSQRKTTPGIDHSINDKRAAHQGSPLFYAHISESASFKDKFYIYRIVVRILECNVYDIALYN